MTEQQFQILMRLLDWVPVFVIPPVILTLIFGIGVMMTICSCAESRHRNARLKEEALMEVMRRNASAPSSEAK